MYSDWDTSWSVSEKVIVDTKKEEKRMNITIIAVAVTAGAILGGTAIYVYQEKCRQKELKLLAECMEKILREEKIHEVKAGEETLYARLESRLVRIQEMLNGRTEAAEKSKETLSKFLP